jgi:hypothetical protein
MITPGGTIVIATVDLNASTLKRLFHCGHILQAAPRVPRAGTPAEQADGRGAARTAHHAVGGRALCATTSATPRTQVSCLRSVDVKLMLSSG